MADQPLKPAIPWPGGKSRLLKYILPLIPVHTCYCEPFAGSLAVLLAKPRAPVEVINDINGDLVRFYRCVRFHADSLITELEFVLNSREEFTDFRREQGLTDIQRSARWFHRVRTCFGGASHDSFGTAATRSMSSREARLVAIRALSVRLDRATIENVDWQRCLNLYDRTESFFFLDPPYTDCKPTAYGVWTYEDVQTLRKRLDLLKGRWLLTLNDAPVIRQIFADCEVRSVDRARGIQNPGGAPAVRYRELVIIPRGQAQSTAQEALLESMPAV